jgi:hypothetical protein
MPLKLCCILEKPCPSPNPSQPPCSKQHRITTVFTPFLGIPLLRRTCEPKSVIQWGCYGGWSILYMYIWSWKMSVTVTVFQIALLFCVFFSPKKHSFFCSMGLITCFLQGICYCCDRKLLSWTLGGVLTLCICGLWRHRPPKEQVGWTMELRSQSQLLTTCIGWQWWPLLLQTFLASTEIGSFIFPCVSSTFYCQCIYPYLNLEIEVELVRLGGSLLYLHSSNKRNDWGSRFSWLGLVWIVKFIAWYN